MDPIISPVDREIIIAELKAEFFLRNTNKARNKIYIFKANDAPNLMQEVGRLRELSFRTAGGGTGKCVDIDECDLHPDGYYQLIVWDSVDQEVIGGYRYLIPRATHHECISTEHYFEFSDRFRTKYLPYILELGRSFVQPKYQARGSQKGVFALDNLWDGIGYVVTHNPDIKYIFGKVTMYSDYSEDARNTLIYFLRKYFPDHEKLMTSRYPAKLDINKPKMEQLFVGRSFNEDYKILRHSIRQFEEIIPPLINSYMQLSPTMKVFDTSINPDFGNVEETGILLTIGDIYKEKITRHFELQ